MLIETFVSIELNKESPVSSEHFLVVAEGGTIPITDRTHTYAACSSRMDVVLVPEKGGIREVDLVTVRHDGVGTGRIYFYQERRQVSPAHNIVGRVVGGSEIVRNASAGSKITVVTNPLMIMTIGMTQKHAAEFLNKAGLIQIRQGISDDDAIVVEQEPELTMEALHTKNIETFGVPKGKISEWVLDDQGSPKSAHYLRKMSGLDHKPVGTLKVFFTYPDMPMITFEGNPKEAAGLLPEKSFETESVRGQLGITNMSRPNRGMIGIRLEGSNEFGPTGEEAYGTNIVGKVASDLSTLIEGLKDGDIIYIREAKAEDKGTKKRKGGKG
jgi:putative methanogenesis marker protein 3